MKNRLQFLILGVLVLFTSVATAQRGGWGGDPEERVNRQVANLKEKLSLSDAQEKKVKEVFMASVDKMKTAREEADGDRSAMREVMSSIRDEQNQELKKYLTDEQFTQYEAIQKEQMEERRNRRRGDKGKRGKKQKQDNDSGSTELNN